MIPYNDYCAGTLAALATVAALARARATRPRPARAREPRCGRRSSRRPRSMHEPRPGGRDHLGPSAAATLSMRAPDALDLRRRAGRRQRGERCRSLAGVADRRRCAGRWTGGRTRRRVAGRARARCRCARRTSRRAACRRAPCLGFADLLDDPHVHANGMLVTPRRSGARRASRSAVRLVDFERTPIRYRRLGPGHGAHTREVLAEAGYDEARIAALMAAGIIRA